MFSIEIIALVLTAFSLGGVLKISNAVQIWRFRNSNENRHFSYWFAATGVIGAGIGTFALAAFSSVILTTAVAMVVLLYVSFRLFNPGWSLSWESANKAVKLIGAIGGIFQGAMGLSGPVAISFVNAVGLTRPQFIFTMSLYFLAMTLIQLPLQVGLGIMTWERAGLGFLALVPLLLGMVVGERIGQHISKTTFDRIIIVLLTLLAIRLLSQNFL